jgi:hypothetical protein
VETAESWKRGVADSLHEGGAGARLADFWMPGAATQAGAGPVGAPGLLVWVLGDGTCAAGAIGSCALPPPCVGAAEAPY